MKSNTVVKIDNRLQNEGISFDEDASFADIIQAFCYLTRFILDVVEDKNDEFGLEDNSEENREQHKEHFIEVIKEWIQIAKYGNCINEALEIIDE